MSNKGPKGKKGRPKKPTKLRLIEGNRSNAPINDKEPKPKARLLEAPKWLCKEARAEWKRLAPALYRLGMLTEIDGSMFETYCNAYAQWRKFTILVNEGKDVDEGIRTVQGKSGKDYIQRPSYANMAQRYLKELTTLAGRFGLSPADRANIIAEPPPGEENAMEALLDK